MIGLTEWHGKLSSTELIEITENITLSRSDGATGTPPDIVKKTIVMTMMMMAMTMLSLELVVFYRQL